MAHHKCIKALALLAAGALTATIVAAADKFPPSATSVSPAVSAPPQASANLPPMPTSDREAAAIQFVRDNHPDLVELLARLKDTKPAQYADAITQLFNTSQRLAQLREQDPQRYQLELDGWKIKSRLQLLVARASISSDKQLESQLREALAAQADLKLRLSLLERDRVADHLAKLNAAIQQVQASQEAELQKHFDALLRQVAQARDKVKRDAAAVNTKSTTGAKSQTIPPPAREPAPSAGAKVKGAK